MMMMALSSSVLAVSSSSSSCLIPSAQHALRVFARSSSFLSLTAPRPVASQQPQQSPSSSMKLQDSTTSISTAFTFTWTFAPLARELNRTAGGFESRARWPLTNGSTLLDMHVNNNTSSAATNTARSAYARRPYSTSLAPHGAIELPEPQQAPAVAAAAAAAVAAPAGMLSVWFPKAQPRLKGFSRKLVLRKFNQVVVPRVARRLTIAIPVLGFYFVSKLMMKDFARVKQEVSAGQYAVAALFSTALVADVIDLAAQVTIISGLGHANLGVGLAGAAALLAHADLTSLATAGTSFSCGLVGEFLSLTREAQAAESAGAEAQAAADSSASASSAPTQQE